MDWGGRLQWEYPQTTADVFAACAYLSRDLFSDLKQNIFRTAFLISQPNYTQYKKTYWSQYSLEKKTLFWLTKQKLKKKKERVTISAANVDCAKMTLPRWQRFCWFQFLGFTVSKELRGCIYQDRELWC